MRRVFTVMLIATAWVVGSTPSFARGGVVHLLARGGVGHGLGCGFVRNATTLLGVSPPPSPTFEDRIPRRSWHLFRHRHKRAGGADASAATTYSMSIR